MKELIECETKIYRTMSCKDMSVHLKNNFGKEISKSTIHLIRRELGFKYSQPKKRPALTEIQKEKRLNFAIYHLQNETNWEKIMFTDETWFYLNSDKGYLWRQWGETVGNQIIYNLNMLNIILSLKFSMFSFIKNFFFLFNLLDKILTIWVYILFIFCYYLYRFCLPKC